MHASFYKHRQGRIARFDFLGGFPEYLRTHLPSERELWKETWIKRRLREHGLRKRIEVHSEHEFREIIYRGIEGPSSLLFLKTEQQFYNEILFQRNVQWQISHLTNSATHFSVRVSLKFHIDGRIAHYPQTPLKMYGRTSQYTWHWLLAPCSCFFYTQS